MNIIHVCPSQSFSGLEQYAFEMALSQKTQGHNVWFLVAPGTELERQCQSKNLPYLLFDSVKVTEPLKFSLRNLRFLRKTKFDVIHLHSTQEVFRFFQINLLSKILRFKLGKIILQNHLWVNHKKKDALHRLFYCAVDEVWCSSKPAKISLSRMLPVAPEKIRIVNYGRNISKTEAGFLDKESARKFLNLPTNAVIFGCVSRIEKSKGISEMIRAMQKIAARQLEYFRGENSLASSLPDVYLSIIGGTSPQNSEAEKYTEALKNYIKTLGPVLSSRIIFGGVIQDSYKYLKAFDIYMLPSYEETFSLSLLDAQLAELPVIGSDSGGTPEVVVESQTGWLFEPRTVESLFQAMERSLQNKSRWVEMGAKAQARVKQDFDQEKIFKGILELYVQI